MGPFQSMCDGLPYLMCTSYVKFEPTGNAPGPKSGPAGLFAGPNLRLMGSCWAQPEPYAKGICILPGSMMGPDMNAGLDAGQ